MSTRALLRSMAMAAALGAWTVVVGWANHATDLGIRCGVVVFALCALILAALRLFGGEG